MQWAAKEGHEFSMQLRLAIRGDKQVQCQKLSVQVSLDAVSISMSEILCAEVNFQSLDGPLNTSSFCVVSFVPCGVLWAIPVDLREIIAINSNVAPIRFVILKAVLSQGTLRADRVAVLVVWSTPNIALAGNVSSKHLERMERITDRNAGWSEMIDAKIGFCEVRFLFCSSHRSVKLSTIVPLDNQVFVFHVSRIGEYMA